MPATAFTVTTVMEPVNRLSCSTDTRSAVQEHCTFALYMTGSGKQTQDLQALEPSFCQAKQGMQTAYFIPNSASFIPNDTPQ